LFSRTTLNFQPLGTTRYPTTRLLDVSASKIVKVPGGKQRVTLTLDCFNVMNANTVRSYSSSNMNSASFNAVTQIIAPRVFRAGVKVTF
jgi:hypothetical protein